MPQQEASPQDAPDDGLDLDWPNWLPRPKPGGVIWTILVAGKKFADDQLTDLAASLTYYAILSIFPALIALMSIVGMFGQSQDVLTEATNALRRAGLPDSTLSIARAVLQTIATTPAPGIGLAVGLLAAVWSASNYVKAFGRALNRIKGVTESRNGLLLNVQMYALTAVLIVLVAVALVLVAVSGPVVDAVGRALHLEASVTATWNAVKVPLLLLVVVLIVALLYHFTPDLSDQRARIISIGAFVAIGIAMLATLGFGFYLSLMGDNSYTRTYGAFAGVIVFLIWQWIINVALLFGGELDTVYGHIKQLRAKLKERQQHHSQPAEA